MPTPPFRIKANDPNFNERVIEQLNNLYTKMNRADRVVSVIEERIRPSGGSGGGGTVTLPNHDHSGDVGDGGRLDWDDCFTDAVHSHASNAEGGQLDWDNIWSDAAHDHSATAEGGQLTFSTAFTNAVHDHTDNAGGGQLVHDSVFASLDSDSHHEHVTVTAAPLTISTQAVTFNYETDDFALDGNNLILASVTKYAWMPAGAVRGVGANPATETVNATGFVILEFADAADDYAQATIKVPDDMDVSADSYICVGWSVPNTSANMTWGYGYLITAEDEDTEAAATTGTTQVTSSSTADGLNVDDVITISGGTIGASAVCIHVYIYRDVSEDTYGNPVDLHGVALKYTANKMGTAI